MIFLCELVFGGAAFLFCPGLLQYSHEKGQKGGSLSFKFNLVDPQGNKLIDQSFFISVLGRLPSILRCFRRSDEAPSFPVSAVKAAVTTGLFLWTAVQHVSHAVASRSAGVLLYITKPHFSFFTHMQVFMILKIVPSFVHKIKTWTFPPHFVLFLLFHH